MEDLTHTLLQANVLTHSLLQKVFISAKKLPLSNGDEAWDKISQILWHHLQSGALKIDDQLLCATCLYTVISLTGREEFYLKEIIQIIQEEINLRKNDSIVNSTTTLAVSLMYGILQSSFLTSATRKEGATLTTLLELTVHLLNELAYDYSRNTFIVFKIISSLKKVCGTPWQNTVFTKRNQIKLLNLVNHNWESPITGVRDLNKVIFQTLISQMDNVTYQAILKEINSFYWNKAKYLMLSEMIARHSINIYHLLGQNDWLQGLSNSLHKPGLVSAGTDMYFAILKRLFTEDDWIKIFLPIVTKILDGNSTKAIENFNNYWCLTTFKKFPSLIKTFEDIFENTVELDKKLHNSLLILKQANKLGIISRNWNLSADSKLLESMVLLGLDHVNVYLRMAAFDIVCEFHGKTMPTEIEYDLVLNYIKNNINSDCTVLRLNMLNSLKNYLSKIHSAYITQCKTGEVLNNHSLQKFLKALQEMVILNLNANGNYQRKITSVKVCSIIWEGLIDIPKNKKMQTRHSETTLLKMLTDNNQWLLSDHGFIRKLISFLEDPSDDIRENIVNLLLNYYSSVLKQSCFINYVTDEALKCIGGKFFYEISCGQSMFKLIVNILLKENIEHATFKTVEDIFNHACTELIHEHKLKRDILESIEKGKQSHSFMDILLVVLDVCHRKSYRIVISDSKMLELLKCLEDISSHFAWEESTSSSDFSKMNDMVEQIIDNSGSNLKEDGDNTKISGVHQMVLNCIWLNVKACCDLASLIIRHCDQVTYIEKFLLIITRALESSRHKGAIESAGAALGQAIQYLTSLPDEADISKIPHDLLKFKLKELIKEASRMASITRRGAGLSIMVHRIVSSDMKKGKPLFHYFMDMILATCNDSDDLPGDYKKDVDNEKDLPKAIYIHFLTRVVIDSSIASDVMYYSPQLAKLAFDNLTSSHWQIRNAALQLYGALVPKLLGQKKSSGFGEDTIATVACDEIRTHSPKLWIYINSQLRNVNNSDKVLSHSVLMPILNMLANSAMRYNFSNDPTESASDSTLLQSLIGLLNSPIYTVRRLTAKSIFNIYSFASIYNALIDYELVSENFMHGLLMLMANCNKYYGAENGSPHCTNRNKLRKIIRDKLLVGKHSYLCKEIYENTFMQVSAVTVVDTVHDTLLELDSNIHEPGIFNWANARIRNCIQNSSWYEIPRIMEMLVKRKEFEFYCEILIERMQHYKQNIPKDTLRQISELLLACENKFVSSAIWHILYEISLITELTYSTDVLLNNIKADSNTYRTRYMLPFIARILSHKLDEKKVLHLSNLILSLCDPENVDVEMRYIAALSNNELSIAFDTLPDNVKIRSIMSAIILLQDEDEDVRNLSTFFCKNVIQSRILYHPYICLDKLLDSEFLIRVLREPRSGIHILTTDISKMLSKMCSQNIEENYNPFANVSKNIYMEVDILQQIVEDLAVLS